MMGVIYSFIGVGIYIYKSKYNILSLDFIGNTANIERINNATLHTVFHYTTYIGLLLILITYYMNFEKITEWYKKNKELSDYYFIGAIGLLILLLVIKVIFIIK